MQQLATVAQYQTFVTGATTEVPEVEAARINAGLFRASYRVRRALRLARLSWAPSGLPADSVIAQEVAFATAAQFAFGEELGDQTGAATDFDSASLIGVAFSRRASGEALTLSQKTGLAPEAAGILAVIPGIWKTAVRSRF